MTSKKYAITPNNANVAWEYSMANEDVKPSVSKGIAVMHERIAELERANKEQKSENQMLREVNARLRKGWCVKEE